MNPPIRCLVQSPTPHSVDFAGTYIDLKKLAILSESSHAYLSRAFSGVRPTPRVEMCERLAATLGMDLIDFLQALKDRVRQQNNERASKRQAKWASRHRRSTHDLATTL